MDKNGDALCLDDIKLDNVPRCPNCNLISLLKLNYKEGKPIINYSCENNHKGDISLEEYLQKYNAYSLTRQDCSECKKKQNEVKGDYFFFLNVISLYVLLVLRTIRMEISIV